MIGDLAKRRQFESGTDDSPSISHENRERRGRVARPAWGLLKYFTNPTWILR
jgi:hypothetical protein